MPPLLDGRANACFGVRAFDGYTSHSFLFVLGNKGVTFACNVLFNVYLHDIMTCHKMIRTDLFRSLPLRSPGFAIEPEITARLVQRGERIFEVPVHYRARATEEGKKLTARRRLPRARDAGALPLLRGVGCRSGGGSGRSRRRPRSGDVSQSPGRGCASAGLPDWHGLAVRAVPGWSVLACVVLAAISAAVLPTVPSYDPWAWISWGREVTDPHLSFAISGGPSWKPLPVMFTTVWALFGSAAAPTLWVITARAGGILGMIAAYLLASRLISRDGRGPRWAAIAAGLIAAAGIVITQDWWDECSAAPPSRWRSPPRCGRCSRSSTAAPAGRSCSAWPPRCSAPRRGRWSSLYGRWLWWKQPRLRVLVVLGLISIPFFWFVPPWMGSGQPFLAAIHAEEYNGGLGKHRARRRARTRHRHPAAAGAARGLRGGGVRVVRQAPRLADCSRWPARPWSGGSSSSG